jgi:hypothetical protein
VGAIVATGAAATYAADGIYLQNKGSSIFDVSAWRTGANASILTFSTDSGSDASPVERMRIGTDGKVGIGTTSPQSTLDISQAGAVTSAPNSVADHLVLRGFADSGMTLLTNTTGQCNIFFGDSDNQTVGRIQYLNDVNAMRFDVNAGERARIDSSGRLLVGTSTDTGGSLLQVNGNRIRVATAKTPASATDTGAQGEICWDANYLYVCTATNAWKRAALSTW